LAGKKKLTPLEVFEANIGDAERLLGFASALLNNRKRSMRRELRESFGKAMKIPRASWDDLDCVESDDVLVLLKPGGSVKRAHFEESELRPLLRQAVVAISAAIESYIAEKAKSFISSAWANQPERLRGLQVELGSILDIESRYNRPKWGYREIVEEYLDREASPAPAKIGVVFSTVGKKGFWAQLDQARSVPKGRSTEQLQDLYARRNLIAHTGDRKGRGRASLSLSEVDSFAENAKSIVAGLEKVL
jgi:hypothetical protein